MILQRVGFEALRPAEDTYRLYALLAPHLCNRGAGNTARVGDYKGVPMLFAEGHGATLALGCSAPWRARSAGFVGVSDGWQDLRRHGKLRWRYDRAENGNVALTGEIERPAAGAPFLLALGFGQTAEEAGHRVRASLADGWDAAEAEYVAAWTAWQDSLLPLDERPARALPAPPHNPDPAPDAVPEAPRPEPYRMSTLVLATHESDRFPGGIIASLSIPWGSARGDDDLGGYHVVWPRDLVESAGALLAAGDAASTRNVLGYLAATQEADGHWLQNFWLDGTPHWSGVQMDEVALPILLVELAWREGALSEADLARFWPMARRAAAYLVRHGPVTRQDRWEEDAGYSPFTLAAEVAALLAAATLADRFNEATAAAQLRDTADLWNSRIEQWTYATDTELSRAVGVEGYYVRITPPAEPGSEPSLGERVPLRIRATVRVIDHLLRIETPAGPAWHRYNGDGYGEHADGSPFDGSGIGRAWPLLTGERAHYELAAGRIDEARRLLTTLEAFSNEGGLIPEQIWDSPDIPERELYFAQPSGSAMPLVWAHAEHVKLLRSLRDGRVWDTPPGVVERYAHGAPEPSWTVWRFSHPIRTMPHGTTLRIETLAAAVVHWSVDGWRSVVDTRTRDTGLGVHVAELTTTAPAPDPAPPWCSPCSGRTWRGGRGRTSRCGRRVARRSAASSARSGCHAPSPCPDSCCSFRRRSPEPAAKQRGASPVGGERQ